MKKRNLIIFTIVAIIGLAAIPFAYGQAVRMHRHAGGFGFGMMGHLAHLKSQLDLSDQQVDQIKAIAKDFHQQNAQYREQLHGGFKSVAEILIKNPSDVAAAQTALDQQTAAENALKANAIQAASKALAVLTPDQRTKLADLMHEHMDHMAQAR